MIPITEFDLKVFAQNDEFSEAVVAELLALRAAADAAKRFGDAYWDEEGAATACMAMEEALRAAGR